jgi:hydroxymethyl cephem carbamoyltransferase
MRVLALKPGHDGGLAFVDDGQLIFSLESEKDSNPRFSELTASTLVDALELAPHHPDVVAVGGWHKNLPGYYGPAGAGYLGIQAGTSRTTTLFGVPTTVFSSTHERSHLMTAVAMAPGAPLQECCVLIWEGVIGSFYHWADYGKRITAHVVLGQPGARYAALYALADPTFPDSDQDPRNEDPGKLMARAAYGRYGKASSAAEESFRWLLTEESLYPFDKKRFSGSPMYNCGLESQEFADAALAWTNRIYNVFADSAAAKLPPGLPLVISGGCGLNCDWNTKWAENQQFSEVFVPPCANDSGSAIGTAIDAAWSLGDPPALSWSVYSGAPFIMDVSANNLTNWIEQLASPEKIAVALDSQRVVAWVRGRAEIGPRALGHRSLLASARTPRMRDRLNEIKQREHFRPIAPVVTAEQASSLFHGQTLDPYMLYFARVIAATIPAVTHVDGTARPQVLSRTDEPALHELLRHVGRLTGTEVLCNTSLNHNGFGFFNRMSELVDYCEQRGVRDIVVDGRWFRFES